MAKNASMWQLKSSATLVRTPVFDVRRDQKVRQEPVTEKDFYVLDAVDWVNVIPVTKYDEVILIELYRHGINIPSIEIPGGMVDPEDLSPMAAAARELREETGYESDPLLPLGVVHPNPAIQNNRCYTFLAPNAYPAGGPDPDEGEEITVLKYPVSEIPNLLTEGKITHSLVITAFLWFFLSHKR
jgi:8-oxo-dGTP pyrophosphatase MutT (NUDIX family)